MPTDVTASVGFFDHVAERATRIVAHAPYFAACLVVVVIWAATGPFADYSDTWQLIINTGTTIFTFLMVALLQNSTRRADLAVQHKLNAIADALGDLMDSDPALKDDVKELRRAVGLEKRESS